jgi:serine protease Do
MSDDMRGTNDTTPENTPLQHEEHTGRENPAEYTSEIDGIYKRLPEIYTYSTEAETYTPEKAVPSPIYYVNSEEALPAKGKKSIRTKVVAAAMALVILLGGIGVFASFYEVLPGDGDTLFSVQRRVSDPVGIPSDTLSGNSSPGDSKTPQVIIAESPTAAPLSSASSGELTIPEIASKVTPSTVGITSSIESIYGASSATGTGIIMSADGYIITNNHVIEGAGKITVELMDDTKYDATLIGTDSRSDLAVIKINATGLTPAEFGDSDKMVVGELVVAIGNPLGLELKGTVTDGIVSAINRNVVVNERVMTLIQTNAAINSGNSGGPLINKYGQVIGVNTLKMRDYYSSVEGLGFAIPSNTVKEIVDQLIEFGHVKGRPTIGIGSNLSINEAMSKNYNLPTGIVVTAIAQNSDALLKGVQVNDIIVKAQDIDILTNDDINRIKEECLVGDEFKVTVFRRTSVNSSNGTYIDITFKLMDEFEVVW